MTGASLPWTLRSGSLASPLPPRPPPSPAGPRGLPSLHAASAPKSFGATTLMVFAPVQRPCWARISRSSSLGIRSALPLSRLRLTAPPSTNLLASTPVASFDPTSATKEPPSPSCSVRVVSHHFDGLLRLQGAGLLHPAADPGVRPVSPAARLTMVTRRPPSCPERRVSRGAWTPRRSSPPCSRTASPRPVAPMALRLTLPWTPRQSVADLPCHPLPRSALTFEALLRKPGPVVPIAVADGGHPLLPGLCSPPRSLGAFGSRADCTSAHARGKPRTSTPSSVTSSEQPKLQRAPHPPRRVATARHTPKRASHLEPGRYDTRSDRRAPGSVGIPPGVRRSAPGVCPEPRFASTGCCQRVARTFVGFVTSKNAPRSDSLGWRRNASGHLSWANAGAVPTSPGRRKVRFQRSTMGSALPNSRRADPRRLRRANPLLVLRSDTS